ncbi:MAG: phosphate/phosphite/phosphonate ABC transporter substrate-binding protein [Deltaproteobacteria bacterium]|nr:phosphate/phosphite/phosphonate ABC transporter substrate-binding protein [Deltaproteobacteria bacterium]
MNLIKSALFLAFLTAAVFSNAFAQEEGQKEFRLCVVSKYPDKRLKEYTPMADYIANRLKEFGPEFVIKGAKVIVAVDTYDALKKIRNNEVDVIFESAFSAVTTREKAGTIPSLVLWKKQSREYKALFFVRKDSPIKTLNDLKGKTIVFEDPESTSAYWMPKAELVKNGMTVLPLKDKNPPAMQPNHAVRYVFAEAELNQAFWVAQKKADAGAFNNNDWDELPQKVRGEFRIIHETKPVLRFVASFHPNLPKNIRNAVEDILINMDQNLEGQDALKYAARINKIERLTDNDFKSLEYVKGIMRYLD